MPIENGLTLFWVKLDASKPERYQNNPKAPAKNGLQIRVFDKARKTELEKKYGFKFTMDEDDGKTFYRTSLNRYTYGSDAKGEEELTKPTKPATCILGDGTPIDPNTVGNGSVGNIIFSVGKDNASRTLKGIQVTKLVVFKPRDSEEFTLTQDFEIIQPADKDDLDGDNVADLF